MDFPQKESATAIEDTFNKIIKEGGSKSQTFWKMRRKKLGANKPPEYDTIDENGIKLTDPEESKEHIASYFEQLYKAREADDQNKEETETITEKVRKYASEEQNNCPQQPITDKELNQAIKKLKKGKSCGPDEIPNEVFIMADRND